jgi:metal-sulfur cluster biosynthetic enzyme/Fe-S cluster assembly iron-binding protein IscA
MNEARSATALELTPVAAEEIRKVIGQQEMDPQQFFLRVGVTGYGPRRTFNLDLTEQRDEDELAVESQGVRILLRLEERARLEGVVIDFKEVSGARGFTFRFPDTQRTVESRAADPNKPMPDEPQVRQVLKHVIDPEVGVNIVDLGLIYGIEIKERLVRITMTMTTPACPLSEQIREEIVGHLGSDYPGVASVEVNIVWEPAWSAAMMTDAAKQQLGWSR